jgi:surface antigen
MRRLIAALACLGTLAACAGEDSAARGGPGRREAAAAPISPATPGRPVRQDERQRGPATPAAMALLIGRTGALLGAEEQAQLVQRAVAALRTGSDGTAAEWSAAEGSAKAVATPGNTRLEKRELMLLRDAETPPAAGLEPIGGVWRARQTGDIRLSPSVNAAIVGRLPRDGQVWAVGSVPGQEWIMVARNGRAIGYVAASLLAPLPPDAASARGAIPFASDPAAPVRAPADLRPPPAGTRAEPFSSETVCRDLAIVVSAGEAEEKATRTACRAPDGSWQLEGPDPAGG